jgi:galactokinase/mevalonate kinase-like predicted kinase
MAGHRRREKELAMIITRSPLRISLGGGDTDLPSYYRAHGGLVIAAAIDTYVSITLHQDFEPGLVLKYSTMDRVASVDDVQHPKRMVLRHALLRRDVAEHRPLGLVLTPHRPPPLHPIIMTLYTLPHLRTSVSAAC